MPLMNRQAGATLRSRLHLVDLAGSERLPLGIDARDRKGCLKKHVAIYSILFNGLGWFGRFFFMLLFSF